MENKTATNSPFNVIEVSTDLWANGRDSLRHALDHFSERSRDREDHTHHDKWIVLSVHHAAECISNLQLLRLDSSNKIFLRNGNLWFPSMSVTLVELGKPVNASQLSPAEKGLFKLLGYLPHTRNQYMHRAAPSDIDVSIAAMCMVGMLKLVEMQRGEPVSSIILQWPPIEGDVVSAIRSKRLQEYGTFVSAFLKELYPGRNLPQCPNCAEHAIVGSNCQACFEEVDSLTCHKCEEQIVYSPMHHRVTQDPVQCPSCGNTQRV